MRDAARFELWSLDAGSRGRLVRTGPKVYYCLRDLKHTSPGQRSPRARVFPGCNQDAGKRSRDARNLAGWSDVYPVDYHQQWIDVTGLHGCFAYVHRADPKNHIFESNRGTTTRSGSCGCPGAEAAVLIQEAREQRREIAARSLLCLGSAPASIPARNQAGRGFALGARENGGPRHRDGGRPGSPPARS